MQNLSSKLSLCAFLALTLCFSAPASALQIFSNARQSDGRPEDQDRRAVVRIGFHTAGRQVGSCTGFFVRNKEGRALIATARHCAAYQFTEACSQNRISVTTEYGATLGRCYQVIASKQNLDTVLFEAQMPNWSEISKSLYSFRLSAQLPQLNTKLRMLGYPASPTRQGRYTVTENCWVNGGLLIRNGDLSASDREGLKSFGAANPQLQSNPLKDLIELKDVARTNCSIYGGNSGGPVLMQDSDIALGMPTNFLPNVTTIIPEYFSTTMDGMKNFVEANASELEAIGVELAYPYPITEDERPSM